MQQAISDNFRAEVVDKLAARSDQEIFSVFELTVRFAVEYATSYELEGPMYLVLDNSLIQSFKHRRTDARRDLHAIAHILFSRFASGWSDRDTFLAVTPAALYEHMGRRGDITLEQAQGALEELQGFFSETGLRMAWVGFDSLEVLMADLAAIHADDRYLTEYFKACGQKDWKTDLRAPLGVKIPLGIAYAEVPDNLPLKYFDPWYVKFVLAARIEGAIIRQSQHDPQARPIGSGPMSDDLAQLNTFNRKGALLGLGDIDMLQVCDVSRQYKANAGHVLVGQTLDTQLSKVLQHRHHYVESVGVEFGTAQTEQQINDMLAFMGSRPFAEHEKRWQWIRPRLDCFVQALSDGCKAASTCGCSSQTRP